MTRARDLSNDEANSGGATPPFTAGKNAIINGDFYVNQRGFTTTTTSGTYGLDRFKYFYTGGTSTYSVQQFTPGAAPVAGYEAVQYARLVTTGQSAAGDYTFLTQVSENPRLFAGQTVTMSFWAKAASGTPKVAFEFTQYFGTGGSPSATVNTYGGQVTLSTSWARYSLTFNVPSVSGKTFGTTANTAFTQLVWWVSAGSTFDSRTGTIGIQSNTFDVWGIQLETGNVATPFTTATGTIQGELAACQRYYFRQGGLATYQQMGFGFASSTSAVYINVPLPVPMRTTITAVEWGGTMRLSDTQAAGNVTSITIPSGQTSNIRPTLNCTYSGSGATQYRPYLLEATNDLTAYVGFSAEL